jgi:acyl carrier protein
MQPTEILETMKSYFAGKQPVEVLDTFAEQSPRALLAESLDVVDFVVYLEEELERDIDFNQLGDAIVNKNFGDLSVEVSRLLSEG